MDDYQNIYLHTHNFMSKKSGYSEIKINPNACPDALPNPWFKIASQKRATRIFSQYEDPMLKKTVVKKYITGGLMRYFVSITHGRRRIKEVEFGAKHPTAQ